jgi:hypothetical protein
MGLKKSLGVILRLKYDCVPNNQRVKVNAKNPPAAPPLHYATLIWHSAARLFILLTSDALDTVASTGNDRRLSLDRQALDSFWLSVMDVVEGFMLGGNGKLNSLPPLDYSLEQFQADEEFEMDFIGSVLNQILPHAGPESCPNPSSPIDSAPDEAMQKFCQTLVAMSSMWEEYRTRPNLLICKLESGAGDGGKRWNRVPIIREHLAKMSLQLLFRLCEHKDFLGAGGSEANNNDKNQRQSKRNLIQLRIARIAFPMLMERCRTALNHWISDSPMSLEACPMPRQRSEEIRLILNGLLRLRIRPGTVSAGASSNDAIDSKNGNEGVAHLIELYPLLCQMVPHIGQDERQLLIGCLERLGSVFQAA